MIEGIIFFVLGVIVTALVAYVIYKRQKKEASESEVKLLQLLEQQMQQIASTASTMSEVLENQRDIQSEFIHIKDSLTRVLRLSDGRGFSAVASAVARQTIPYLIRRLPKVTALSKAWICSAHRQLFPGKTRMAGVFRDKEVWVSDNRRSGDKKNALFVPPPPDEVEPRIDMLLNDWNNRVSKLQKASLEDKLRAIAEFHYQFVSIHPFIDGNGTLARLLTCIQMRDLTAKTINLALQDTAYKPRYYLALEAARESDIRPLINIIKEICGLEDDIGQSSTTDG
jgi:Fic family protein